MWEETDSYSFFTMAIPVFTPLTMGQSVPPAMHHFKYIEAVQNFFMTFNSMWNIPYKDNFYFTRSALIWNIERVRDVTWISDQLHFCK